MRQQIVLQAGASRGPEADIQDIDPSGVLALHRLHPPARAVVTLAVVLHVGLEVPDNFLVSLPGFVSQQIELLESVLLEQWDLQPQSHLKAAAKDVADLLSNALNPTWAVGARLGVAHVVDEGEVETLLSPGKVRRHVEVPAVGVRDNVGKLIGHLEHVQIRSLETN